MSRLIAAVGALCLIGLSLTARGAGLFDSVQLVASTVAAASAAPASQTVTITQAGSYTVTLTDLQLPAPLASLNLAVVNSTSSAVSLSAAGSQTVTLAAGTYTAQVLAVAASGAMGGTFSVEVVPAAGGAAVWQYEATVGPAASVPSSGQSALSAQFTASAAGTYQLTAADLAFPMALRSLSVGVFVHCGTTPGCTPTPIYTSTAGAGLPYSAPLTLAAGTYDLYIVAIADPVALQGLYSIQIAGGGTILYGATEPVGQLPAPSPIAIATGGSVSLNLVDLAVPTALTSIKGIVTQGGSVLQQVSSAGMSSFTAAAGTLQLYVAAKPGSAGQGAYEAYFSEGSQTVADIAQPVLASDTSYGYAFSPPNPLSAGSYQVSVHDFQTPVAFQSLNAVIAQQGAVLATATTSASASFTAAAGPLSILVFPTLTPASGNGSSGSSNGLFRVSINAVGSSTLVYEAIQGVGASFSSQPVTVTTVGTYDLNLTDFGFPASFTNLAVITTSGDAVVGAVFSTGQSQLKNLTPGTYALSVLAQVGLNASYGLYGLDLSAAPPAPTVTLTSSAGSVASGQSATLTWSSTNATSCTASGAWNGTLATSGSQSTGALTESSSFTLSCTGGGGTGTSTVQVAVTGASGGGGGGGALTSRALLMLLLPFLWALWRRRLTPIR